MPIEFLRPIPSAALIPLLFLTLGTTLGARSSSPPSARSGRCSCRPCTASATSTRSRLDTARSFRLGRNERLFRVTLPSALPVHLHRHPDRLDGRADPRVHRRALHGHARPRTAAELLADVRAQPPRSTRSRSPPASSASAIHFAVVGGREARAPLAPVAAEGTRRREPAPVPHAEDLGRDRRADPSCRVAALTRRQRRPEVPARRRRSSPSSSDLFLFSQFETNVVPSLERIGVGFAIAVVLGVAIGIPLGLSRIGRSAAMPHIEYWRAIPPPALLPISIILLHSIGNTPEDRRSSPSSASSPCC